MSSDVCKYSYYVFGDEKFLKRKNENDLISLIYLLYFPPPITHEKRLFFFFLGK